MSSIYARLTLPALPAEVLSAPALRTLRGIYADHAAARDICADADDAVDDSVATIRRNTARFDHAAQPAANVAYAEAREALTAARRNLADLHSKGIAEIVAKREVLRPLVVAFLTASHADAIDAVQRAKNADHAQRGAVASLRALDVIAVQRRPGIDPEDADFLTAAVVNSYESVLDLRDPSAARRRNVGMSWRDVAGSVAGLPVAELAALDALSPQALAPVLGDIASRQNRRTAIAARNSAAAS